MSHETLQMLCLVVLAAPLVGFLLQYTIGRRMGAKGAWMTVLFIGASLAASLAIGADAWRGGETWVHHFGPWTWFEPDADSEWTIGMTLDGLTAVIRELNLATQDQITASLRFEGDGLIGTVKIQRKKAN